MIVLTMGDPAGIGPEVVVKALAKKRFPVTVIGSIKVLEEAAELCGVSIEFKSVDEPKALENAVAVIDLGGEVPKGKPTPEAGLYAYRYIVKGAELVMKGKADALVTGPVNKLAVNLAGIKFTGHTGLLADLAGGVKTKMLLYLDELRVSHVTTHIPLRQVPEAVTPDEVITTVKLTSEFLRKLGEEPAMALAALNPHAGEGGIMGNEEEKILTPTVKRLREMGYEIEGPLPSDTLFYRALKGEFNAVIALYHDQGHIPVKLLGFERAVNVTLGLPYVRTSVDHGTAYDIAGKGIASEKSMLNALTLAEKLAGKTNRDP